MCGGRVWGGRVPEDVEVEVDEEVDALCEEGSMCGG